MKFKTVEGVEYFRVLHDNLMKVCYNCMSANHVIRDCPNIVCHHCKEKGHYARNCDNNFLCDKCGNKEDECVCSYHESDSEYYEDSDQSDGDDLNEEVQDGKVKTNKGKLGERAEENKTQNNARKVENKENPHSKTQV